LEGVLGRLKKVLVKLRKFGAEFGEVWYSWWSFGRVGGVLVKLGDFW